MINLRELRNIEIPNRYLKISPACTKARWVTSQPQRTSLSLGNRFDDDFWRGLDQNSTPDELAMLSSLLKQLIYPNKLAHQVRRVSNSLCDRFETLLAHLAESVKGEIVCTMKIFLGTEPWLWSWVSHGSWRIRITSTKEEIRWTHPLWHPIATDHSTSFRRYPEDTASDRITQTQAFINHSIQEWQLLESE